MVQQEEIKLALASNQSVVVDFGIARELAGAFVISLARVTKMTEIAKLLSELEPKNGEYLTVAIDGRGASGKSTLAEFLGKGLPRFAIINGDDFFEPIEHPILWGEFNEERFQTEVLGPVNSARHEFTIRPYDFPAGGLGAPRDLSIGQGVIIERCFSFELPINWDIKIWVESPSEICLERGLRRDGAKSLGDRATAAWTQIWQPKEARYISASSPMNVANFVVDGSQDFDLEEWLPRHPIGSKK